MEIGDGMQLRGYEDRYYVGVADCLKRNFVGLGKMSDADFEKWFAPIINYSWLDRVKDIHPWTRGVVLLENDSVVGYFGLLFSIQKTTNNPHQLFVNFTTWAIDDAYRFQVFGVIKEIEKIPNAIFTDYSACEAINCILTKLCHFQNIETTKTAFFPFPCFRLSLKYQRCSPDNLSIENRTALCDHSLYLTKAIKVSNGINECVVFYKVTKHKLKKAVSLNRIFILHVDNVDFFSRQARAIIFKIEMIERGYLIIDNRFLGGRVFSVLCKTREVSRLAKSKDEDASVSESNYLYSEFAVLFDL